MTRIRSFRRRLTIRYEASAWFRLGALLTVVGLSTSVLALAPKEWPHWVAGPLAILWILFLASVMTWLFTCWSDEDLW